MAVNLPLTGSGQSTAAVATEQIGGAEYQFVKLVSGSAASTVVGSAALLGTVAVSSGAILSTSTIVGLGVGSSANMIGQTAISTGNALYLGLGTSATYQHVQSIPFSTATIARTSVSTTIDISIISANANRKSLIIANASTVQIVALGFSTAAVTTARANANVYLAPVGSAGSFLVFGMGHLPLYTGPIRGINISSTTVAGYVNVTEWT